MPSLDFRTEKRRFRLSYNESYRRMESAKEMIREIMHSILITENIEVHNIQGRIKNREECINKFSRKYKDSLEEKKEPYEIKDHISDLIGLRIILLYESDIETVGSVLAKEFDVIDITNKTQALESRSNIFGYKGLHLDIKLSDERLSMCEYQRFGDLRFEVQVRTIIQDAWSTLDHKIKYKKAIPLNLERRINSLAALFEIADREFLKIHQVILSEEEKNSTQSKEQSNINVFSFTHLMHEVFPDLQVNSDHVDEFVANILSYGDLSYQTLKDVLLKYRDVLNQFMDRMQEKLGQYFQADVFMLTTMALYLLDSAQYKGLFMGNDQIIAQWCKDNNVDIEKSLIKSD